VRGADDRAFVDYVVGAYRSLRRTAFLITGDWYLAEDAVQAALVKVYVAWSRLDRGNQVHAYARRAVVTAVLDEGRRPWRRERSVAALPDEAAWRDQTEAVDERLALITALGRLPTRQRATLVLRYFDDLSVEDTAHVLGCTPGTVKSHSARGLDSLRLQLGVDGIRQHIMVGEDIT
jgi:RNA polymerase sigma-70 factor (sigma-E family)